MSETVRISIDGVEHEVPEGEVLIKAAQDAGTYIPRFCWHERMKPVGMCRMCLVQVETERGVAMVTACTNPVAEGMAVDTKSDEVQHAQEAILEYLLANHPLDCPVCDKGGECPLQDQAFAYGPGESRFVEIKRTFEKPIPISDLVLLDRERCILCARCTRFSDEISGDPLIEFLDRGNQTEVNTFPDLPFSSYYSGNTVQICPVGALTAVPYRFRARPWDLVKVESSSLYDTAHPRIEIHVSQNEVLRYQGVDNDATNHGWLSDKARFGFEYLDSEQRITTPLVRRDGDFTEIGWQEAIDIASSRLSLILEEDGGGALGVMGGAQGTNEDAYALSKFARTVLGTNNVDSRMDDSLASHFLAATVDRATIADLDDADTILVWGPDLKEVHPTLYLRTRRAAQELGAELIVVHPRWTGLDDRAAHKLTYLPGRGHELAEDIESGAHPNVAAALSAGKVVALLGVASRADGPRLAESVAALVRQRAGSARILPLAERANVYGALDMGLAPDLWPGRAAIDESQPPGSIAGAWGAVPTRPGLDTRAMLEAMAEGEIRALLLVGADPVGDSPDRALAEEGVASAEYVISIDMFLHDSNRDADLILPSGGFSEEEGTATNVEGRVQKLNKVRPIPGQARTDWSILEDLSRAMGRPLGLADAAGINKEISEVAPAYHGVTWDLLEWERPDGAVVPLEGAPLLTHLPVAIAADPPAGVGSPLHSARVMYDGGVRLRHSQSLGRLAPGPVAVIHPSHAAELGVGDGDRIDLSDGRSTAELAVRLDAGTPPGMVFVPENQPGGPSFGVSSAVRIGGLKG